MSLPTYAAPAQSLYKDTIDALAESVHVWWKYIFIYTILATALQLLLKPSVGNITLLTQLENDPAAAIHTLITLTPYWIAIVILWFVSAYVLGTAYLAHAMQKNKPVLTIANFLFWLKYMLIKLFKPILWMLLPIIGWIFYIRAIIRRMGVSPMAILKHPNIIKNSWEMTEGKAGQIFIQGLILNIVLYIAIGITGFGVGFAIGIFRIAGGQHGPQIIEIIKALISSLSAGILMMANAIFACTVYRTVLKEYKSARQANTLLQS